MLSTVGYNGEADRECFLVQDVPEFYKSVSDKFKVVH